MQVQMRFGGRMPATRFTSGQSLGWPSMRRHCPPSARLCRRAWVYSLAYGGGGIPFGTPTRFGNVAAQLKLFMDLAGELWQQGKLIDKVATTFTSSQTEHGGQESTILALNNTLYHCGAFSCSFSLQRLAFGFRLSAFSFQQECYLS